MSRGAWPTPAVMERLATPPEIAVPSATGVSVRVVLAGPGARSIAFVLDFMMRTALGVAWFVVAAILVRGDFEFGEPEDSQVLWYLVVMLPATAIFFLYHLVLEILLKGRTPGKRITGLRVLTPEGTLPTAGALVTRNVFRLIDSMPFGYVVGLMFVMLGRKHVRLGDMAAGTVVAIDRAAFLESLERDTPRRGSIAESPTAAPAETPATATS
jgi:uncharacterized RDD family membrane protein YckC